MPASSTARLAGGVLAASMWSYASNVFAPAQALKRAGLLSERPVLGDPPVPINRHGLGPYFSSRHHQPVLLETATDSDHLVEEFDRMAEVYDAFVRPFSGPIFAEALRVIEPHLRADARVLDAGCGSGRELRAVTRLVPRGEVVGVDLAAGMVNSAFRAARAHGIDNCAFFQSDISALPATFGGRFDLIYNSLAHHHYPDPEAATASILRCLRPGGLYCVVDPGPAWFNAMATPLARVADPGWVGFRSPRGFMDLFRSAGFARSSWSTVLPGFGVAIAQKSPAPVRVVKKFSKGTK